MWLLHFRQGFQISRNGGYMPNAYIKCAWGSPCVLDALDYLTGANVDILQNLQISLAQGSQGGENIRKLGTRVQTILDTDRLSAMVITRNIVGYVLSKSRHESVIDAGLKYKIWLHTEACKCPGHDAVWKFYENSPIPILEPFVVNDTLMQYLRDFSCTHPKECVGCQCLMIAKHR